MDSQTSLLSFNGKEYSTPFMEYVKEHEMDFECSRQELFMAVIILAVTEYCNLTISAKLYGKIFSVRDYNRYLLRKWVIKCFLPVEYHKLRRSFSNCDSIEDIQFLGGSLYAVTSTLR